VATLESGRASLVPSPAQTLRLTAAGRAIRAMSELYPLGFVSPTHEERMRGLYTLASAAAEAAVSRSALTLSGALAALEDSVDRAGQLAVEELHAYGVTSFSGFFNLWEVSLDVELSPQDRRCPYCSRLMSEMRGRHFVHERVVRHCDICHRCGSVLDLPGDPAVSGLTLRCAETWQQSGVVDVELVVDPVVGLSDDLTGWVSVHTSGAELSGVGCPVPWQVTVSGTERTVLRTRIEVGAAAVPHHHFLRALVMFAGRIYYASRPVAVEPPRQLLGIGPAHV
jgi:hypothetical protein